LCELSDILCPLEELLKLSHALNVMLNTPKQVFKPLKASALPSQKRERESYDKAPREVDMPKGFARSIEAHDFVTKILIASNVEFKEIDHDPEYNTQKVRCVLMLPFRNFLRQRRCDDVAQP
jgi:hypothetical protein